MVFLNFKFQIHFQENREYWVMISIYFLKKKKKKLNFQDEYEVGIIIKYRIDAQNRKSVRKELKLIGVEACAHGIFSCQQNHIWQQAYDVKKEQEKHLFVLGPVALPLFVYCYTWSYICCIVLVFCWYNWEYFLFFNWIELWTEYRKTLLRLSWVQSSTQRIRIFYYISCYVYIYRHI